MTLDEMRNVVARSDAAYRDGDIATAMTMLQPMVADRVEYFRPYYNLGFYHWLRAEYALALPHLSRSVEIVPKFADGHLLLGKCQVVLGNSETGLAALDTYIVLGGADPAVHLWRARALHGLGRRAEASAIILDGLAAQGWTTPRDDGLAFSQEPWFAAHIQRWQTVLSPALTRIERALEVGSMEGMSALWSAEHLLSPAGRLAINDIEFRPSLTANLAQSRFRDRIDLHLGDSAQVLPRLPEGSYDFAYVDGDHSASGVFRDCVNVAVLTAPGAYVVLDDYGKANETTRFGIDLFLDTLTPWFEVLDRGYQIFLRRRDGRVGITTEARRRIASAASPEGQSIIAAADDSDLLMAIRTGQVRLAV